MNLRSTIATPAGKRRYVRSMFATIADRVLFLADGQIAKSLARPSQAEVIDAIQEVAGQ